VSDGVVELPEMSTTWAGVVTVSAAMLLSELSAPTMTPT
jgi:hypothetical protein